MSMTMVKKEAVPSEEQEVNYLHFPGQQRPDSPNDKYVPLQEAQEILGISARRLYDLLRNGSMDEVKTVKYAPGVISFRLSDLLDFRIGHVLSDEEKRKL